MIGPYDGTQEWWERRFRYILTAPAASVSQIFEFIMYTEFFQGGAT